MKKIILLIVLSLSIYKLNAQCTANFTYSLGTNGSVSFSNTSVFTGTNVSYLWNFGDNSPSSNAVNPTHVYATNGVYSVFLFMNDSMPPNSCTSFITQTIVVTNTTCLLSANVSTYQSSGGVVHFTDLSTGTIPNTSYTINFGDNSSSNMISSHTYSAAGVYTVNVTADNGAGCTSTFSTVINVSILSCSLTANFNYTVNGGQVSFQNTTTGAGPNAQYFWYFENGNNSNLINPPQQTFLYNGNYTVTLNVLDSVNFFCSSTITKTIAITSASCYANSSFTLAKDSTMMPAIVWNAYPNFSTNVVSATWNWGDNSSTTALYPSHTYSAAGIYTICLTVSVSCGNTSTTCVSSSIFRSSENLAMAVVNVINPTASLNELKGEKSNQMFIHPNPTSGKINVEFNNTIEGNVIILDNFGKHVYNTQVLGKELSIDLELPAGIYFLKCQTNKETLTRKIVKVNN